MCYLVYQYSNLMLMLSVLLTPNGAKSDFPSNRDHVSG